MGEGLTNVKNGENFKKYIGSLELVYRPGLSKKETCLRGRGRGRGRSAKIEPFYEPFYNYIILYYSNMHSFIHFNSLTF